MPPTAVATPTPSRRKREPLFWTRPPRAPKPAGRTTPTLLILACLFLLATTSYLSYVFISKRPQSIAAAPVLVATPRQLRSHDIFNLMGSGFGIRAALDFSRDSNVPIVDGNGHPLHARSDASGAFSVQINVLPDWAPGLHRIYVVDQSQLLSISTTITVQRDSAAQPRLQLSDTSIDLGADVPGATSSEGITLINSGGGQLNWQASSDQAWLSIAPGSGSFGGSANVTLTANRGGLVPRVYVGKVTFTQRGNSKAVQFLTVRMVVRPAPASLSILPASLVYAGSTVASPPAQSVTLQNNGGQPLDWSSVIATGDGANWLSIAPVGGHLDPGTSAQVTVNVLAQRLAVGTYKGTVNFSGGTSAQLTVTFSVVAPGNLVTSPPALTFTTSVGKNPPDQSLTLQNSGGEALDWLLAASTNDGAKWLTATPGSGHLGTGARAVLAAKINASGLSVGSYQGTLVFTYGANTRTIAVSLTVSPPPVAQIAVSTPMMTFITPPGTDPTPQSLTITNLGNAPLNWSVNRDSGAQTYLPLTATNSSGDGLAPGQSVKLTIAPSVSQLSSETFITAILTVADTDPNSSVQSQEVTVIISVKP